jgi:hypothetical protein
MREGELAVKCIACPKAGVNLPEGWEKAPVEMRYAFTMKLEEPDLSYNQMYPPLHS